MSEKSSRYAPAAVDRLLSETTLQQSMERLGVHVPESKQGNVRIPCPCCPQESEYGTLSINVDRPFNPFQCFGCGIKGNRIKLMWLLSTGQKPSDGPLRGDNYKQMVDVLWGLSGGEPTASERDTRNAQQAAPVEAPKTDPPNQNIPLRLHENEKVRDTVDLHRQLVTDPAHMTPAASLYFAKRSDWLTPEMMQQWRTGYQSRNVPGMWRGQWVFAHRDEAGEIITYSSRDLNFHEKWDKWRQAGAADEKRPAKHRYVSNYHKGLELYGQHQQRLERRELKQWLGRVGLVIVEGQWDVVRLDQFNAFAEGLCMNRATDEQVAKMVRHARVAAGGRIWLMPDNDSEGEKGFKELLWKLSTIEGITARSVWSRDAFGGSVDNMEPEDVTPELWNEAILPSLLRRSKP